MSKPCSWSKWIVSSLLFPRRCKRDDQTCLTCQRAGEEQCYISLFIHARQIRRMHPALGGEVTPLNCMLQNCLLGWSFSKVGNRVCIFGLFTLSSPLLAAIAYQKLLLWHDPIFQARFQIWSPFGVMTSVRYMILIQKSSLWGSFSLMTSAYCLASNLSVTCSLKQWNPNIGLCQHKWMLKRFYALYMRAWHYHVQWNVFSNPYWGVSLSCLFT